VNGEFYIADDVHYEWHWLVR